MIVKFLPDLCDNLDNCRVPITESDRKPGNIPYYGASGIVDYVQDYIFDEELLLVSEDGANLIMRSSPIAFSVFGKTWVNNHAHVLRFRDPWIRQYVELYLNSISLEPYITGSTQPKLNQKKLNEIPIPIPTEKQIHHIVRSVSAVHRLISLRKQQLAKLDELVKSRFVELFGDTKNNEYKWKTLPLYKVLESGSSVSYGIVQTGDDIEGGIPVFRPVDIAGGKIPQREQLKRTAIDISNQYSRTLLKGYELLITVRGSVGETFRVTSDFAGCNVGRNIVPLRFDTTIVDYSFMQHFFAQEGTKRVLESMTKGIALQGLNMSEFREIDVIIPNMSLQQQFAAFVEQTDKSKLTIRKSLVKLEVMRKALMQRYFG